MESIPDSDLPEWAKPKPHSAPASEVKADLVAAIKKYAFIVGTAILVIGSFRNSLTWHFESFWGSSKYLWQDVWRLIYVDLFKENRFVINVFGGSLMAFLHFWTSSLFFLFLDICKPRWAMKYKIQEEKSATLSQILSVVPVCMLNQLIAILPAIPLFYVADWRGILYAPEDLPTFQRVLIEGVVFTLLEEFLFYYSHRLLHHPWLYKYIHKKHHEWTASIAIVSIYAHPLEHIVSNWLPVVIGPILMGSHVATSWLWIMTVQSSTQVAHSGYHLPFLPSPEAHDFHHLKFINNFGIFGFFDRLHGTDHLFVKSKAYDRHILMIGLKPVKEVFPDEPKKGLHDKQQ